MSLVNSTNVPELNLLINLAFLLGYFMKGTLVISNSCESPFCKSGEDKLSNESHLDKSQVFIRGEI